MSGVCVYVRAFFMRPNSAERLGRSPHRITYKWHFCEVCGVVYLPKTTFPRKLTVPNVRNTHKKTAHWKRHVTKRRPLRGTRTKVNQLLSTAGAGQHRCRGAPRGHFFLSWRVHKMSKMKKTTPNRNSSKITK